MRVKYDIVSKSKARGIAVTVDLTSFALAEEEIFDVLHITPAQLEFVRMNKLPSILPGCVNSIYYEAGCIRNQDAIVENAAQILARQVPWVSISRDEEDHLNVLKRWALEIRNIAPIVPTCHVVTLASSRRAMEGVGQEIVQVHVSPKIRKKLLQYKSVGNNAYEIVSRIAHLTRHGVETNSISVGNTPLRDLLK